VRRPRSSGLAAELALIGIGVAAGLLLVGALIARPYGIPSDSMAPTLKPGEHLLVSRLAYRFADPAPGDIVVFHPPAGAAGGGRTCGVTRPGGQACPQPTRERADETFVKRVIAGPGQRVTVRRGRPVVDGRPVAEPFTTRACRPPSLCDLPREIVVPPGHYFVMGDSRGGSIDSRYWGPVPREWVIGEAVLKY
jgi:signal peptidase I